MKQTASILYSKIKKLSKKFAMSKGVVLMYHRISGNYPDPWKLNVSESNFQDQLELFSKRYNVLPLKQFDELRKEGCLPQRALSITFDDGYADNALLAAPLLREAQLPATFYICTGTLGSVSGMWWDTLAQIVFGGNDLPDCEKLEYENKIRRTFFPTMMNEIDNSVGSKNELLGTMEQVSMENMYMHLWKKMQPMRTDEQINQLELYVDQLNFKVTNTYPMMQDCDVRHLSGHKLFEIGAHTCDHIKLSAHDIEFQELEIQENIQYLTELTGQSVNSLSYPFGSYNRNTLAIAKQVGIGVACTTVPAVATRIDDSLLLPRITVTDVSAESLQAIIDSHF